jgi:hypothetical protein
MARVVPAVFWIWTGSPTTVLTPPMMTCKSSGGATAKKTTFPDFGVTTFSGSSGWATVFVGLPGRKLAGK